MDHYVLKPLEMIMVSLIHCKIILLRVLMGSLCGGLTSWTRRVGNQTKRDWSTLDSHSRRLIMVAVLC